jgi:DNA-binding SARP family transcriptional activator
MLVALGGLLGATAGNASNWIVVGLGGLLAVVSIIRPVERDHQPTSRKLEVEAPLYGSNGHADSEGGLTKTTAAQAAAVSSVRGRIALRTIGSLVIEVNGRDQTQRLRDQPRLEFLFSYLVARSVCAPDFAVDRAAIAEEMAPGIAPASQRDRLRKTLHAFQSALGPDLKGLVRVSATQIRLDLTGVNVDFVGLKELASRVTRRGGLIDASLAEDVRRLLEAMAGELLAGFSELEHQVTGGNGSAHQVVEEARSQIGEWQADLVAALARHLEAAGRTRPSIAYLQSALAQSPQREDLARLLVAAYMQTGQTARAEETRLEYELGSGEAR